MTTLSERKVQLQDRLGVLTHRIEEIEAELQSHQTRDWEDQATEREGDEVMQEITQGSATEIRAINAALERIEAGTYGICVICGVGIEDARLDLLPFTPFCKDHAP
ncbi:MAG: TraR/DksA C4-type zinc finger protein [bacterium]